MKEYFPFPLVINSDCPDEIPDALGKIAVYCKTDTVSESINLVNRKYLRLVWVPKSIEDRKEFLDFKEHLLNFYYNSYKENKKLCAISLVGHESSSVYKSLKYSTLTGLFVSNFVNKEERKKIFLKIFNEEKKFIWAFKIVGGRFEGEKEVKWKEPVWSDSINIFKDGEVSLTIDEFLSIKKSCRNNIDAIDYALTHFTQDEIINNFDELCISYAHLFKAFDCIIQSPTGNFKKELTKEQIITLVKTNGFKSNKINFFKSLIKQTQFDGEVLNKIFELEATDFEFISDAVKFCKRSKRSFLKKIESEMSDSVKLLFEIY